MGEEDEVSQSIWTCPEGQGGGIAKEGKQQVWNAMCSSTHYDQLRSYRWVC